MVKRIRVLVARLGLDKYDHGAEIVARSFRCAGFEVLLCEIPQTPEQVAEVALQEDVDVVTLLLLSGMHNTLFPKTVMLLRDKGMNDVLVIGGGIIPQDDVSGLREAGVATVFVPGTPTIDIVEFVKANVLNRNSCDGSGIRRGDRLKPVLPSPYII